MKQKFKNIVAIFYIYYGNTLYSNEKSNELKNKDNHSTGKENIMKARTQSRSKTEILELKKTSQTNYAQTGAFQTASKFASM